MLEGNGEQRTIGESYAGAISSGSTRVGNDHTQRTPGDIVAAGGMSRYRTGMALMRLVTEWNSGATPPAAEPPSLKELREAGIDASVAHAERRRRAAECTRWNMQENMLRLQRLKTLPAVRAALVFYVQEKGWEDGPHLVAAVLQHYLSPKCPDCGGSGLQVVAGTGGRSRGKVCGACRDRGAKVPGVLPVPYGGRGQRLLDYIGVCTGVAAADLREGAHRLHRGGKNVEERHNQRSRDEAEKLRRADAEAEADAKQDAAKVAAQFKASMGQRRKL